MKLRLYVDNPKFKMPHKRLTDKVYSEAIESFVIVGADALFVNRANKTLLLAKRKAHPSRGFWLIGGRIFAGEPEVDGMRRIIKKETSLVLAAERFHYIYMNRYLWKTRQQEPQSNGSDNLCYTFAVELTPEESITASQHLDPNEYDTTIGLKEFNAALLREYNVHQAIIDLYGILFEEKIST